MYYAGAQMVVLDLSRRFKARGWDTRVISMLPPEGLTDQLEAAQIPWASLDMSRGSADPRALWRLRGLLREWRPSIVHGHMVHANLLSRATRPFVRTPVLISTAHNIDEGGRAREIAYRLTDPLCDLTTNVSRAAVDRYIEVRAAPRRKISFVPNGIDTSRFQARPERRAAVRRELGVGDRFVWLAVGRLEEQKDHPNMLRALAEAGWQGHDGRLLIVGEGPDEPAVRALAGRLGVLDQVSFLGVRRDVPDLMNAADAYLMSSAWEGMPLVLLEAAASGLPIVATDVGGNREVAIEGSNGLLAPARDPAALARRMLELLALPAEERRAMGARGREYVVTTYDLESVIQTWEGIYTGWLRRKGVALA